MFLWPVVQLLIDHATQASGQLWILFSVAFRLGPDVQRLEIALHLLLCVITGISTYVDVSEVKLNFL